MKIDKIYFNGHKKFCSSYKFFEEAIDYYQQAFNIDKEDNYMLGGMGLTYRDMGDLGGMGLT